MTREEAKELLKKDNRYGIDWIIDDIYDDFESRVCENCKHKTNRECNTIIDYFGKDFGCNKFERKEDESDNN